MKRRFAQIFSKTSFPFPPSDKCSFPQPPLSRRQLLMGETGNSFLPLHFHNYGSHSRASSSNTWRFSFSAVKKIFFRVYILRYLNKCLCVPATFEVKPNNILISNYESLQLTSVFGLIDFIVHFISPVKRKLRVLFSIRSSILISSINIYILLLLWQVLTPPKSMTRFYWV